MASAYSITTYRDPEKVNLDSTFKAQAYKQQNYDQYTTQMQQLINQYAGTDLLRDVDKQYFGERLNTLVSYINESGSRDWSRKSVANELQNYVSNAIDDNVVAAIGSTRAYRDQMTKINTIKEKNPELWSVQNEEFATQDLNRYLKSGKVGDSYKAREYINYKDVQKHILDNAKTLKEFGVEYHHDPIGGNAYFTRIGKSERIAPEVAKQYVDMMLTPEMRTQLAVDGWYTYKDVKEEDIKSKYYSKIDANLEYSDKRLGELKLAQLSATTEKKAAIQQEIDQILSHKSEYTDRRNNNKISTGAMITDMYTNDFYDKNTSFLSYDRLIDTYVDDSGFKIADFTHRVNTDNAKAAMEANKFNYQIQRDSIGDMKDVAKMDLEYKKIGYKPDGNGSYILDPDSPLNPMSAANLPLTDVAKELGEEEVPDGFIIADSEHSENAKVINSTVSKEIDKILADPKNSKLAQELGVSKANTSKGYAWLAVNSPEKAKVLYNLLSDESKFAVDKARSSTQALRAIDPHLNKVRENAKTYISGIEASSQNDKKMFDVANNNLVINEKGDVVSGSILNGNRKDNFAETTKFIGFYNSMLASGGLNKEEEAKYKRLILNEIRNTKDNKGNRISPEKAADIYNKMLYREKANTVGSTVMAAFHGGFGSILKYPVKAAEWLANTVSDSNDFTFGTEYEKDVNNTVTDTYNSRGTDSRISNSIANKFRVNEDIGSIGDSDIKLATGVTASKLLEDNRNQLRAASEKLTNYTKSFNKAVNVSMGTKIGQAMLPYIQSVLPVGTNIEKDSNLQMVIDPKTGLASITASVKDGKEYSVQTFEGINMANLPPQVLQNIKTQEQNKIYTASNPHAVKYSDEVEVPTSSDEYSKKLELLPEMERYKAWQDFKNNPFATQEGILNHVKTVYGEEIVTKNAEALTKIISTPVEIQTEAFGDQWSLVGRQNGNIVYISPPMGEVYDRNLISQQSEKLASEIIQNKIKEVITNGRK